MIGEEQNGNPSDSNSGITAPRKTYWRSASWSERSPNSRPKVGTTQAKTRLCLPPLQPLSIARRNVEEWPKAGSDDLGEWPHPPTPGGRRGGVKSPEKAVSGYPQREFQLKKDKLAFFDKECSRITDHIYLGSEAVAKNREILRKNGITHVLNCVGFVCPEYFKEDLVYKTLWLQDNPSEDITSILYDVFDYFEEVREQNGRVLVHCCQGISRSTSLAIAYLMWRDGQSFENAFQLVKAARGVVNPNMGFACQLLQCQKRVHAVPASPNSVLRMYRMAPHSSYDPLHLVPKVLHYPSPLGLDSRGAFIIHVPSGIYVWVGVNCNQVMANDARVSAFQVVRYERAQGLVLTVEEGKELPSFWDVFASNPLFLGDRDQALKVKKEANGGWSEEMNHDVVKTEFGVGKKMVVEYDTDFEIFHKALSGGVVSPCPLSRTGNETCLPARESGWGRIREKFVNGIMKEIVAAPQFTFNSSQSEMLMDSCREEEFYVPSTDPPSLSPSPRCRSPNSFNSYSDSSPDSNSKSRSPLPSPSLSDHSSFFTTSPASSNWSDSSSLSYQLSPREPFDVKPTPRARIVPYPFKGFGSSIAERRGNTPPSLMLPPVDEPPQLSRTMVRSWTFSHLALDENVMESNVNQGFECQDFHEPCKRELPSYSKQLVSGNDIKIRIADEHLGKHCTVSEQLVTEVLDVINPVVYRWPNVEKVDMFHDGLLDSKSVFLLLAPEANAGKQKSKFLYVWVGRDAQYDQVLSSMIGSDVVNEDKHFHWENVGNKFLAQMGLPMDTPVQITRDGEETRQFLEHLPHPVHQAVESCL
ncbi:hypothetical protein C5167_023345 [Papaver somniferum]|uniref:Protein-tyrosine-phosphatase n=1 Tax=Papaver somniferum TaxID=3469 RepID=A0A4Y7JKF7_PAPSO|nr:protein-tyrosine-phosphatase MKP1-like [Papaver somniferum]RZC61584.1 hypothetical protein C5167_023345 [Papaver somniferum]